MNKEEKYDFEKELQSNDHEKHKISYLKVFLLSLFFQSNDIFYVL